MESRYVVGTSEFKTRAQAIKKAKEYANDSGSPETVYIERWKTDKYTKTRGRVLGFSASSILPTKSFVVMPSKKKSNPAKYSVYAVQSRSWLSGGFRTEQLHSSLDGAKKTARSIAKGGVDSRVMNKDTGKIYISYKAPKSNPSIPKGKFIKCKAVKFNRNGSISIKK